MVKLLDSFRAGDEFVATIFADEKTDVPGTKEELEALLLDVGAPLSCGTLIITSAFDVAFVRSDGLIQWKGEEPPVQTVTFTSENYSAIGGDTYSVTYTDENNEEQTATFDENDMATMNLTVLKGSTLTFTASGAGDFPTVRPEGTVYTEEEGVYTITMDDDVVIYFDFS